MANNGFTMSPEAMIENGTRIKNNASKILNSLEAITATMRSLPENYQGKGSDQIIQKFNELQPSFKDFETAGNSCGELLITDARATIETEEKNQQLVNQNFN